MWMTSTVTDSSSRAKTQNSESHLFGFCKHGIISNENLAAHKKALGGNKHKNTKLPDIDEEYPDAYVGASIQIQ